MICIQFVEFIYNLIKLVQLGGNIGDLKVKVVMHSIQKRIFIKINEIAEFLNGESESIVIPTTDDIIGWDNINHTLELKIESVESSSTN